jgi:ribosome-interacting GTPase 1
VIALCRGNSTPGGGKDSIRVGGKGGKGVGLATISVSRTASSVLGVVDIPGSEHASEAMRSILTGKRRLRLDITPPLGNLTQSE